jgi:hypothetical protein
MCQVLMVGLVEVVVVQIAHQQIILRAALERQVRVIVVGLDLTEMVIQQI